LPSSSLSGLSSLILFPLFAAGVIDTGGKFVAGVVDTGGKLPPVSFTPAAKIRNGPNWTLWGWGGNLFMKKPEAKNLVTPSL
jgi:hypothetical protein